MSMKYYTGTCTNYDDVQAKLIYCCTDAGWSYNEDTKLLSKGDIIVRLYRETPSAYNKFWFGIYGRTSGGVETTNAVGMSDGVIPVVFPAGYRCFIFDDPVEVYFILVDSVNHTYQHISFGKSNMQFTTGTGNWVAGEVQRNTNVTGFAMRPDRTINFGAGGYAPAPFFARGYSNSFIHTDNGWMTDPIGEQHKVILFLSQPNVYDNNTLLIPIEANAGHWLTTTYSKFCNNRFILDETIITVGAQKWMVFPLFKRNVDFFSQKIAPANRQDTECFAWAIRRIDLETT